MNEITPNPILIDPEMKEIVESFLVETKEILEKLDYDLLELEKRPDDSELLNQVFRSFHTIKGTSGFLGLEKLPNVTHECEDLLNKLRKKEVKLYLGLMDGIILGFDTIKALLKKIEVDKNEDYDITKTAKVLENLIHDIETGNHLVESNGELNIIDKTNQEEKNIKEGVPQIEMLNEELSHLENRENNTEKIKEELSKKLTATTLAASNVKDNTIRVDVDRLDALLDIVSELVLGRNRLMQVNSQFGVEYEGSKYSKVFGEVTKQIDLMTTELQLVVMKLRMIKIGKIFNRYPRLVRDLCKDLEKDVELIIKGEETEVDKNLIEEINDPLVHLIRNAVDHGIEKPDERAKAGKEIKGTVILAAEHLGNNIQITIEDNGNGIDPIVIRDKAIEKGLITKEKAKDLTRIELMNLIFLPGFSTAKIVSNVSGRGVGMDVVKTNVAKLRGIINIDSEVGKGTKIIIKLPLTLAIIPGMIVKVHKQMMVIPLGSVIEVLRVNKKQIHSVKGKEVITVRDSLLPLVNLNQLLKGKLNGEQLEENDWQYVVGIGIAEKRYGIKVDELVGQQEVVIKSLGAYLGKVNGIAGSTIMGDGTVVMILDINELFNNLEVNP
jgi:two-component system chemotaxis sensor kinase CheA